MLRKIFIFVGVSGMLALALGIFTYRQLQPIPKLNQVAMASGKPLLRDRNGELLNFTVSSGWNVHDQIALHQVPSLLQNAFIVSEDKRFYAHTGVDWLARFHAVWQSLPKLHLKRGASTINEQVVRLIHPRPRTLGSKWIEGFEAKTLNKQYSKIDIFEFYLNQLPYGAEQRGVKQAAYFYFSRDLDTLSVKETLALVVLARAPSFLVDPKNAKQLEIRIHQLAQRLNERQFLSQPQIDLLKNEQLIFADRQPSDANTFHFANFVFKHPVTGPQIITTLDSQLQKNVKSLLEARLQQLSEKNVQNGAVLIADHASHEILAWVVSGNLRTNTPGAFIDAVTTPRQPGSTLKPFIYTMALEKGWTAATLITDEPLQTAVGRGLHTYHNYSHQFYGEVTLREALANSLNIPAVKALEYVGNEFAINQLRKVGMNDLTENPSIYGDGLALGNGEISLFELVQAYSVLANRGEYSPLQTLRSRQNEFREQPIFSSEATSIISNILADDHARQLEFGSGNSLSFAVETAAKTGTSTDHCDAWIVAYNYRYIVGIWLGNLNREPMREVTGSTGPALLAQSIFSILNKNRETQALYLNPKLKRATVCAAKSDKGECLTRDEWFIAGTEPKNASQPQIIQKNKLPLAIQKPSEGLNLAMDPRIPDALESFEFALNQQDNFHNIYWHLDGEVIANTNIGKYLWRLTRGKHTLTASANDRRGKTINTDAVTFYVK